MATSLNKTDALTLTNKAGANVNRGDVVVLDLLNKSAFTITGSSQLAAQTIGVVLDTGGIVTGSSGLIAINGYVPQINLLSGSTIGQTIGLSSVAGKAIPHSTILPGDFGQVLAAGTTPDAILWGNYSPFASDYFQSSYSVNNIPLGVVAGVGFTDITGSSYNFIPLSPGKYKVEYEFIHYVVHGSASAVLEQHFRITDGTTNGDSIFDYSSGLPNNANIGTVINVGFIFNWTTTVQRTIKLQGFIPNATSISSNFILNSPASNPPRYFKIRIYRIGT